MNKLFEKGKRFLEEIKPEEKILLLYHVDVDGICSAALALTGLKKLGVNVNKRLYSSSMLMFPSNLKSEVEKADKIILVDVPTENTKHLPEKKKILIFDHHPASNINSKNIVLINPRLENKTIYQPTSYTLYKFFSQFFDMEKYEWIAAMGTVGDFGYKDCKDLLKKHITKKPKDLKETRLSKAADRLNSFINYAGVDSALKFLLTLNSIDELEKNKNLESIHRDFENEMNKAETEFFKNAEVHGRLIFGVIESKHRRMGSSLSTVISNENPKKIIVLLVKKDGSYNANARNQAGEVDVGKLMKKCCDIEGGGHKQAGGGNVKDLEKFKKCLLKNFLVK